MARLATRSFASHLPACVVEELEQEAWLRTWQAEGVTRPQAFGRRVFRNLAVDYLRRDRTRPLSVEPAAPPPTADPVDVQRVRVWLQSLGPTQRALLERLFLHEEPVESVVAEVAGGVRDAVGEAAWGRARDLVYKRRRRGLAALRARVGA